MRERDAIFKDIKNLIDMYRNGVLGGEMMPEDVHPDIDRGGPELCHYFTLPMALNYQRNSYALWRSATQAFEDKETKKIFDPYTVSKMDPENLWPLLARYKVGLQSNRHTQIWHKICTTIANDFDGDVRNIFKICKGDIGKVLNLVGVEHKEKFPYLGGPKISNYWLYVMSTYTDVGLMNRAALSIAPDTHVIQASQKLGLISDINTPSVQVAEVWRSFLQGTEFCPIDIHTPLWLWSRSNFTPIISAKNMRKSNDRQ